MKAAKKPAMKAVMKAAKKPAMKAAMKAKKPAMKAAMKAMKAKKAKVVGKKAAVFAGRREHTVGGLKKSDLKKNKQGKIVSAKASARGKKDFSRIKAWVDACKQARKELKVKGFVAIKKGSPLYNKTKQIYTAMK